MQISFKWGILVIAVLLAGLLVLTACGGDDDTPTETEIPTPSPSATEAATTTPTETAPPSVEGPTWVYQVTYDDSAGAEVTNWTLEVNAEETVEGVDCWVAEGAFDVKPFREAMPSGSPVTIESIKYSISKDSAEAIKDESQTSGMVNVMAVRMYDYTGDHGQPFAFEDVFSIATSTELTPAFYDVPVLNVDAEVAAVEEVELPGMGTMVCYKVEYSMQGQPLSVEWYSAEYDLLAPVKVADYSKYKSPEIKEMTSYDPMPAANATVPDVTGGEENLTPECKGEGETIPVIANPPECCEGLTLIPPKEEGIIGISGICTAKCGDGTCDPETETAYNCPDDCEATSSGT